MKVLCKEFSEIDIKEKIDYSDTSNDENNILCLYCKNLITNHYTQIKINDSHKHVFANPHGIVFEIGCYKEAVGCMVYKGASKEFSWFLSYNWRIAVCNHCSSHLGWLFTSDSNSFFGLIIEKLDFN
ncbi:MAG: hypothetical protein K8R67_15255 [Desulfobacteraceae bacterium]|nr:hypothetical protein [Desulfobacteraceae bacterium]